MTVIPEGSHPTIRPSVMLGVLALAATSNAVLAQQGGQPPATGPEMALALEAARAAVAACATDGVKAATSVVDSTGVLRLLLTADGTVSCCRSRERRGRVPRSNSKAPAALFAVGAKAVNY